MSRIYVWIACLPLAFLIGSLPGFSQPQKKIVLIAGIKTHGPGEHEYPRTARLLKVMLDQATNLKGIKTELHFNGWPKDPATLNDADVILMYADGSDDREDHDPLLTGDHLTVLAQQMQRGCGLVLLHYSTFAPKRYDSLFQEWTGGYFDYENGKPSPTSNTAWYSAIQTLTATVKPVHPHPATTGVPDFSYREEFYYKIHFRDRDSRLQRVMNISIPGEEEIQTIAWAVERNDGGRGFGFTGGHFYTSWANPLYRKFLLNAIVWSTGLDVPVGGVDSRYYTDDEVDAILGKN